MSDLAKFFISELFGSFILILFGNGVVACAELTSSKGSIRTGTDNWLSIGGGLNWLGIGIGWGLGIFFGAICSGFSDHQLNPAAVVFNLIKTADGLKTVYTGHVWWAIFALLAEFIGMVIAQLILDITFWLQMKETPGFETMSMHASSPSAKEKNKKLLYAIAFIGEFVGTLVLLLAITLPNVISKSEINLDGVEFAAVAGLMVTGLVITIGGVTGPALNPFRDLAPRIIFSLLKIPNKQKGDAQWRYAFVPIVAPLLASVVAGGIFIWLNGVY